MEYYLSTMKEFIHDVNLKNAYHIFKKECNPEKFEKTETNIKVLSLETLT